MKRLFPLVLLGSLLIAPLTASIANAQTALPQPNSDGDYTDRGQIRWQVVDPDPNGLNCRWSASNPREWYSPAANFPMNVTQWAAVRRFPAGTVLTANTTPAGFALMFDTRNKPWVKVSIGSNDEICLVRANRQFIRPIN